MHSYAMNDIFLKTVIFFKVFCDFLNTSDYKIDKYNLITMLLLKHIWYEMVHKTSFCWHLLVSSDCLILDVACPITCMYTKAVQTNLISCVCVNLSELTMP